MKTRSLFSVGLACAVGLVACSSKPKAPERDSLVAQLQQEAQALRAENENQDTSIGVRATWEILSVNVTEAPEGGEAKGTIRFRIRAETQDTGDEVQVDEFEKQFDYVYNTTLQKWVFEYTP